MLGILQEDKFRMPLLIAIIVQFSQQLSGINAIFYYSASIFMNAGLSQTGAQFATIAVGVIMVVVTLISVPLMDRVGRRNLMLWGLGGMIGNSVAFTIFLLLMVRDERKIDRFSSPHPFSNQNLSLFLSLSLSFFHDEIIISPLPP